jgi:uncharacterized repeat protein (TIGR01451 family)
MMRKARNLSLRLAILALMSAVMLGFVLDLMAYAAPLVQTYYVPLPEQQVRNSLATLYGVTGNDIRTVISIVPVADGTILYYDHWEDGYDADISNPIQATTEVWGDNDPANGIPPGFASDVVGVGDVVVLENTVPANPRNRANIFFDGQDKFAVSKPVAVTRAAWAITPGTVLAGAVEVYDTRYYGTSFEAPVGEDIPSDSMFEYTSLLIMASEDNTTVQIDWDADGTVDATETINEGESYQVPAGADVVAGAAMTASAPVQVHMITGDIATTWESRWYTLLATGWDHYYNPVSTASVAPTDVFVYNPGATPITVEWETDLGAQPALIVLAGGVVRQRMPDGSGAHFYTTDGSGFFAIAAVDADSTNNRQYDWGFSLVPGCFLTTQALIGWGPGVDPSSPDYQVENGSPVWVTPVSDTTVYVDYDGDPTTGPFTDPSGNQYDVSYPLNAFQRQRVFDPDGDQTGMLLYTVDGTDIAVAWGQDPSTAGVNNPYLDLGTTVPPLLGFAAAKGADLVNDADADGQVSPGDTLVYTITIQNISRVPVPDVVVSDTVPLHTGYVANSTEFDDGTVLASVPDAGITPFPLDEGGVLLGTLPVNGVFTVTFQVTVDSPLMAGVESLVNQAMVSAPGQEVAAEVETPVAAAPILEAEKTDTLFLDADGNGVPSPGDTLRYEVTMVNSGNTAATGVTFSDIPDPNTTLVVGSVQTSQGTVTSGNAAGDASVGVDVGAIPAAGSVDISFQVTINSPLPAGVRRVANHGLVSSNELPVEPTDDPDTLPDDDETVTPVTAAPVLEAEKRDELFVDADGNGVPSPGDTLRYEVTIVNSGNTAATGVTFSDMPDPNTTLVVGSVQTSQGTVTSGNAAGDTSVAVDIGAIPAAGSVSISFQVTINSPLPAGVRRVANQGLVSSNELPVEPTNDPDTLPDDDETVTPVTAAPVLEAEKRDELFIDADGNGVPSPGDTLLYEVTIVNSGNAGAAGVVFSDTPDPNTTLVVGSVQTSRGTVISGNAAGDTGVAVDVGIVPGGGSVDISFQVTINSPLPAGVTQVANYGLVSGDDLPVEPTDDPDTLPDDDRTVTPVTAAPVLEAEKRDELFVDADGNGVPSPGDTLLYLITIVNSGNAGATGVVFSDIPDPNTTLVVGSVQTNWGTVTSGNAAGDTSVAVDIGAIPGGGSVDVSFQVTINSPLPAGVTQVANLGLVSSNELPVEPTNDPDTLPDDRTVTPVTAVPVLEAEKRDELFIDADGNGVPSPGDTLLYKITIVNSGNTGATGVVFSDTPDPNTTLVVGSVQTSQGAVTSGNAAGDTSVGVDVGAIPAGGNVDISFRVLINDPFPAGVTQVANQGLVSSNELPVEPTDDPDTLPDDDETVTPVVVAPNIEAYKADELLVDADGNLMPSPGDTLVYEVTIVNSGNADATGVTFSDTPDPNTTLVVGSVRTSQGMVTRGNNAGDTSVAVDIGTIPRGGTVNISLQVIVNDPLPEGVTQISNQGLVSSNELPDVPTDDPESIERDDSTPTAVELLYFRIGGVTGRRVRLEWATAVEIDNFGFNLYRASVADRSRAEWFAFVPSQARNGGATYVYEDTVPADGLWWYWLADVDTSGRETFHGPVSTGVGVHTLPHRVYLPLVMR